MRVSGTKAAGKQTLRGKSKQKCRMKLGERGDTPGLVRTLAADGVYRTSSGVHDIKRMDSGVGNMLLVAGRYSPRKLIVAPSGPMIGRTSTSKRR